MTDAFADAVGIDVVRGMPFATPGGDPLRLDLFRPAAATPRSSSSRDGPAPAPAARRAAVVLVPGERWRESDRGELSRYALDLAERGYVCVVPDYRGSDVAAFPAQIRDLKAAIRWLRASASGIGVDPERIGAFGHDAGAHLAVLAALTPDRAALAPAADAFVAAAEVDPDRASDALAAVVGVAGTYALEHQPETDALSAFLGGDRESAPDAWERASPSTHLSEGVDAPPTLLLHGEDDDVVPAMASELFYDLLEERDAAAECVVAADAGHDVHEGQRSFVLDWSAGFFDRHLR